MTRATPEYFAELEPELQDQVKLLIKEIVGVGFRTGLLKTGAPQYPLGGTVGTEDEQCADAWSKVSWSLNNSQLYDVCGEDTDVACIGDGNVD